MKNLFTKQKALLNHFVSNNFDDDEASQIKRMLKQFLQGNVSEVIAEEIITALARFDHCMALFEQIWPNASSKQMLDFELANEPALRLEYTIKREIQRLNRMQSNCHTTPSMHREPTASAFMFGGTRPFPTRKQRHIKINPKQTSHNKN